ncbi:hypothetical protein QEN19_001530 [Hanseniaspora menglaensis]
MNVLVYNGEGASLECIKHTIDVLKVHLEPFYSVQQISKEQLLNEPWYDTTKSKMLVFPGGYDTPYNDLLLQESGKLKNLILNRFSNGIFMGICAGGYLGADSIEFDIPTQSLKFERPLKFFGGLAKGPAFVGFEYNDNRGAKAAKVSFINKETNQLVQTKAFYNGGSFFVDANKYKNVEVLATYDEPLDIIDALGKKFSKDQAAVVLCKNTCPSNVKAVLMGPHFEYIPKLLEIANSHKENYYPNTVVQELKSECDSRDLFWKQLLKNLGLRVNEATKSSEFGKNLNLTPIYASYKNKSVSDRINSEKDYESYQFEHDSFQIFKGYQNKKIKELHKGIFEFDVDEIPKSIVLPSNYLENQANRGVTPFFNSEKFFSYLLPNNKLANVLLLTERITSTSTLLDTNPGLLKNLFKNESICNIACVQIQGKGRSGNAWVSPKGILASTISYDCSENHPQLKVFYLQYIAAMAMCDSIRQYYNPNSSFNRDFKTNESYSTSSDGYCQIPIVIKWPNDLYILKPSYYKSHFKQSGLTLEEFIETSITAPITDTKIFTKVAGILLNLKYTSKWQILFGIGVNCFNKDPNPCVQDWVEIIQSHYPDVPELQFERIEARYINCLDIMLKNFELFDKEVILQSFLKQYYKYWLHSGQIVTLQDFNNAKCKIIGISSDYGYLEAQDLQTGNVFQLQPDGNSFNIFEGLISKKVNKN